MKKLSHQKCTCYDPNVLAFRQAPYWVSRGELDVLANSFLHTIFSLVFKENREVVDLVPGIINLITNM